MAENKKTGRTLRKLDLMVVTSEILSLTLAVTNYLVTRDLFIQLNVRVRDTMLYAITAALILDGLPYFMGLVVSRGEGKQRRVQLFAAGFAAAAMAVMLAWLRLMWLQYRLSSGLMGGRDYEEIFGHCFLMVLPLLNAMAAFALPGLLRPIHAEQPKEIGQAAEEEGNDD